MTIAPPGQATFDTGRKCAMVKAVGGCPVLRDRAVGSAASRVFIDNLEIVYGQLRVVSSDATAKGFKIRVQPGLTGITRHKTRRKKFRMW